MPTPVSCRDESLIIEKGILRFWMNASWLTACMRVFHVQSRAVRFIPAELHLFSTFVTEIIMLDGLTIVYRSSVDVFFYVIGSQQENELILVATLNAIFDAISLLDRKSVV